VPPRLVADAMVAELRGDDPARFLYHLGDIVYLYGEEANYQRQFLEPYAEYAAPIFAIPENHDGDPAPGGSAASLDAFVEHFCTALPSPTKRHVGVRRTAIAQPNVYWTFEHDWITIIGAYTNVPEGGHIADEQQRWLTGELHAARPGVTLILAMHHPVYSIDSVHGPNLTLGATLDRCFAQAGRAPDAVFAAHAHNYQRFTRTYQNRLIPYLVAGAGGYPDLHQTATHPREMPASFHELPDVTLERYQDTDYGFITITAGPAGADIVYTVTTQRAAKPFDSFSITPAGHHPPPALRRRHATSTMASSDTSELANEPTDVHSGATPLRVRHGPLRIMQAPDCHTADASASCRCARCEHTRAAEGHESLARRLHAAGEHHRARLEAVQAAAARVASAARQPQLGPLPRR
jgi:hypothetical protein